MLLSKTVFRGVPEIFPSKNTNPKNVKLTEKVDKNEGRRRRFKCDSESVIAKV